MYIGHNETTCPSLD